MMKVKVKTDKMSLFILSRTCYYLSALRFYLLNAFQKRINKWIVEQSEDKEKAFTFHISDKKELQRCILKELKNHRGLGLVNVKAKDGTEVVVKL